MRDLAFEENKVLFGADPTEGIVAVEPIGGNSMRIFLRSGSELEIRDEVFTPFILLEEEKLLQDFSKTSRYESLSIGAEIMYQYEKFETAAGIYKNV